MMQPRNRATPVLGAEALSKSFGGLQAVRGVSLSLYRQELHAIIGPNGAGKSTLVNLLSGELSPTSGTIKLDSVDVTGVPGWKMRQLGVARSFQRTNILKSLTVLENVRLAAQAIQLPVSHVLRSGARESGLIDNARAALARAGLDGVETRQAGALSHGAQRQLEIAMAIAGQPKVLLLDEPLAGMGQEEGERMASLLKSLAEDHAVLLIEHDMDFVFKVADWMTVMVEGAVLAEGRPADVRKNAEVQRAYLGGHA
jgi:branched-chain amino acid transport system ATP-binding protein